MSNFIAEIISVEHTGKSGDYNYYLIKTHDHEGSIATKKDSSPFVKGDLIEYTLDKFKNGNPKISVINKNEYIKGSENQQKADQPKGQVSADVQTYIIRQSSLQRSLEFFEQNEVKPNLHDVCVLAEALKDYVLNGTIPAKKEETQPKPF